MACIRDSTVFCMKWSVMMGLLCGLIFVIPMWGLQCSRQTRSALWLLMPWCLHERWHWFNIKMSSYLCRKSHCGDKMVIRSSYLHNGISYRGKMTSLYWISHLVLVFLKSASQRIDVEKSWHAIDVEKSWHDIDVEKSWHDIECRGKLASYQYWGILKWDEL